MAPSPCAVASFGINCSIGATSAKKVTPPQDGDANNVELPAASQAADQTAASVRFGEVAGMLEDGRRLVHEGVGGVGQGIDQERPARARGLHDDPSRHRSQKLGDVGGGGQVRDRLVAQVDRNRIGVHDRPDRLADGVGDGADEGQDIEGRHRGQVGERHGGQ